MVMRKIKRWSQFTLKLEWKMGKSIHATTDRLGYMPKSKSQVHITPQRVYDMIEEKWDWKKEEMFDPCPVNPKFDGLEIEWQDKNYVNPEYAVKTLTDFVKKAIIELDKGHESIMLLPANKTDQDWFHDLILANGYDILWIRKRLHFTNNKWSSPAANFLVKIC